MYSILLLAAVGLGSESPTCGHRCHKCPGAAYGVPYQHLSSLYCYPYSYGYSCYGNLSCTVPGGSIPLATPTTPTAPDPPPAAAQDKALARRTTGSDTAMLVVRVPRDARLYIDGRRKETSAGQRVFATPALQRGEVYSYALRTEVVRQGKSFVETKRVLLRAGETIQVTFPDPSTADIVRLVVLSRR